MSRCRSVRAGRMFLSFFIATALLPRPGIYSRAGGNCGFSPPRKPRRCARELRCIVTDGLVMRRRAIPIVNLAITAVGHGLQGSHA